MLRLWANPPTFSPLAGMKNVVEMIIFIELRIGRDGHVKH